MKEQTINIQATAKRFKLATRLGGWGCVIATIWATQDPGATSGLTLFAFMLMFVYGRVGKWWHHE